MIANKKLPCLTPFAVLYCIGCEIGVGIYIICSFNLFSVSVMVSTRHQCGSSNGLTVTRAQVMQKEMKYLYLSLLMVELPSGLLEKDLRVQVSRVAHQRSVV